MLNKLITTYEGSDVLSTHIRLNFEGILSYLMFVRHSLCLPSHAPHLMQNFIEFCIRARIVGDNVDCYF